MPITRIRNRPTQSRQPLGDREHQFAALLWRHHSLSRWEIHERTGVHPTLTGNAVASLIQAGLIRDGKPLALPDRGRPRIPVEIDPDRRTFLGVSISPGEVRLARLDPTGRQLGDEIVRRSSTGAPLINLAAKLLAEAIDGQVYSIGITITGIIDPDGHALLFSSAIGSPSPISLEPLYAAAGKTPVIIDNDMNGLALRWFLTNEPEGDDVLLVGLDDGRLGASVLINGQPHRGSVTAASELGHMRLNVETDRCFCGQIGCLERIFSTSQLHRLGMSHGRNLNQAIAEPETDQKCLEVILDALTTGLANAINFIRPQRLVIASPLVGHLIFTTHVREQLPPKLLPGIRERTQIVFWTQSHVQAGENAAWLALADVFGKAVIN